MVTKTIRGNNLYDTERYIRSTFPTLWLSGKRDWQGSLKFLSDDGHGHVCTVSGDVTRTGQGPSFGGVNGVITVPDAASLDIGTSDFSYGFWAKTAATGGIPFSKNVGGGAGIYFKYVNATTVRATIGDTVSFTDFTFTVSLTDNVWHRVLLTCNRDSATGYLLYKDGVVTATVNDPTALQGSISNAVDLYIGAETAAGGSGLVGSMGEVLIYNGRALTQVEAQRDYLATAWRYR